MLVGKPPSFISSFKRSKVGAQLRATPRNEEEAAVPAAPHARTHARASVAGGHAGYRPACSANKAKAKLLCARRSCALACDAVRCGNAITCCLN